MPNKAFKMIPVMDSQALFSRRAKLMIPSKIPIEAGTTNKRKAISLSPLRDIPTRADSNSVSRSQKTTDKQNKSNDPTARFSFIGLFDQIPLNPIVRFLPIMISALPAIILAFNFSDRDMEIQPASGRICDFPEIQIS